MSSIACPACGAPDTKVYDTRASKFNELRRRRKCPNGHRFVTFESVDHEIGSDNET